MLSFKLVLFQTYGAEEDKILNIENENVRNVVAARKFVGWYNGLPTDKNLEVFFIYLILNFNYRNFLSGDLN